jgi:hypothetical protein
MSGGNRGVRNLLVSINMCPMYSLNKRGERVTARRVNPRGAGVMGHTDKGRDQQDGISL